MSNPVRDRFDDVPRAPGRVGAHRAEQPGMSAGIVLLWAAAATLVLIVIGIFGVLVAMDRLPFSPSAEDAGSTVPVDPKVDTSYTVLILNATPDEGLPAGVQSTLIGAGWKDGDVLSSAGTTQDFAETTVFYVDGADAAAAAGLADLIGGANVEQSDHYASMETPGEKQLTVVLGLDRIASAPASPPAT